MGKVIDYLQGHRLLARPRSARLRPHHHSWSNQKLPQRLARNEHEADQEDPRSESASVTTLLRRTQSSTATSHLLRWRKVCDIREILHSAAYILSGSTVSPKKAATRDTASIPAAYLHVIIDPRDRCCTSLSNIGKVPQGWLNNTRSVLIVRDEAGGIALTHAAGVRGLDLSAKLAHIHCIFASYESEAIGKVNTSSEAVQEYMKKHLTKEKYWGLIIKQMKEYKEIEEEIVSEFGGMSLDQYQRAGF
jgi:hypothetical protein